MAASQVLDLPELFEAIVLQLPMRDLLFAQRVSKTWRANLDASPAVQKALFFTAGKKKDIIYVPANDITPRKACDAYNATQISPTLTNKPRTCLRFECLQYMIRGKRFATAFNPLLTMWVRQGLRLRNSILQDGGEGDQSASWRRMFLTQPPRAAVVHFVISPKVWAPLKDHDIAIELGDKFEVTVEKYRRVIEEEERIRGREGFEVLKDIVSVGDPKVKPRKARAG
ncbi:hypothetical protein LTR56_024471 [Elasticomyces elasticus]|nr:hypothetical protein LTR56_024471 [Elasticomyces elasticus]KAK3657726.1 hypothetical protein LTR22_009278 [Elasticomyces elasticus]KAK4922531.1 hypothetical protein LTR49_010231 [Elasticomyces elasticus]KAK5760618.1 hypothetical protein LTS12_009327 [Elasticomyces elasticus]